MYNCLFLLCPTDCLESCIDNKFKQENYFYTSLGNSISLDVKTLESIKKMIIKHNIRKVYFVLSSDNRIVLDALGGQSFSDIKCLKTFYEEIKRQKDHSEILWQSSNQFTVSSYYMNCRINELQNYLNFTFNHPIGVYGKIYNRQKDLFLAIYSDLVCLEKCHLN